MSERDVKSDSRDAQSDAPSEPGPFAKVMAVINDHRPLTEILKGPPPPWSPPRIIPSDPFEGTPLAKFRKSMQRREKP